MIRQLCLKIFPMVFLSVTFLCGQNVPRVIITGRVIDDSTSAPLQNVNVFLAHTTLGSGTDEGGRFSISNVPVGSYEIVASRVGYSFAMIRATLSDSGKNAFEFRLKPSAIQVGEVVVTAPELSLWKEQLKKFVALFLGKSANASICKILNPEVLDFESGENGLFVATAQAPLEIDNRALGYHIRFILTQFKVGGADLRYSTIRYFGKASEVLLVEGFPEYIELKPNGADDMQTWRKNRQKTYLGSLRHFLSSLFRRELSKNGFLVYLEPYISGKEWEPQRRPVTEDDILFDGTQQHQRVLKFNRYLEIEYTLGKLDPNYDLILKKGTDNQVSWLILNHDAVTIDSRGSISEWFPIVTYGYWSWQRMADALPLDYVPEEE